MYEIFQLGLTVYWLVIASTCLPVLLHYRSSADRRPSTITRKFFHLVILAVYIPALFIDVPFLYLASACALAALVIFEVSGIMSGTECSHFRFSCPIVIREQWYYCPRGGTV